MPDFASSALLIGALFTVLFGALALYERRHQNHRDAGLLAALGLVSALGSGALLLGS